MMPRAAASIIVAVVVLAATGVSALRIPSVGRRCDTVCHCTRRQFVASIAGFSAAALLESPAAHAASGGSKTPDAAKKQIVAGYKELGDLLADMQAVTDAEGGDGIRRVLGTVGTTSSVYLIEPAFRLLFEADESLPMEYIENVEQIMLALQEADSQAYSANFITFSSAKGKPEDYFKRSSQAIVRAREKWAESMKMLGIGP